MAAPTTRDRHAQRSLGTLHSHIKKSRVLLVGAGGIGCELLKNLVLTGFGEVDIVDLDTIDLSNLNRQFLFRQEHIKKSKATVSKESAGRFNPNVKLEAHHANISDRKFNVEWFKQFKIVFNALDNVQARRHVNKMCLAANIPLIESGTTGFNGQVQVIRRGMSECYECNQKETATTFPVCTIRNTPSQPIHCIVWAKSYLFATIFGMSSEDETELDYSKDDDNAEELENLREEAEALRNIRQSVGSDESAKKIFQKVFKDDIQRLGAVEELWKSRKPPTPLVYSDSSEASDDAKTRAPSAGNGADTALQDQSVWSYRENLEVFKHSISILGARLTANSEKSNGASPVLTFDKDDDDTLNFVASASNLRSIAFGIEPKSKFDIKQMAGKIIPAIATTNAIVAGLCVLQAFKVMKNDYDRAKMVFLTRSADRILSADKLSPPNPNCAACGNAQLSIEVDLSRATLSNFVNNFLRSELGYGEEFSVTIDAGSIYDPEDDENLPSTLEKLGIQDNEFITVVDEADKPRLNLVIAVTAKTLPDDSKPIVATEKIEIPLKKEVEKPFAPESDTKAPQSSTNGHTNGTSSTPLVVGTKRKASSDELEELPMTKKGKAENAASQQPQDGPVILDDEPGANSGAIVIDD